MPSAQRAPACLAGSVARSPSVVQTEKRRPGGALLPSKPPTGRTAERCACARCGTGSASLVERFRSLRSLLGTAPALGLRAGKVAVAIIGQTALLKEIPMWFRSLFDTLFAGSSRAP